MARAMPRMRKGTARTGLIRPRRSKDNPLSSRARRSVKRCCADTGPRNEKAPFLRTVPHLRRSTHVPQRVRDDAYEGYCNLTETLSLAPVASITDIRMKPLPGGCHCVSRRRCGSVTGVPSTSQV